MGGSARIEEVIRGKRAFGQDLRLQATKHTHAKVVENSSVRIRLTAEFASGYANVGTGQFYRREESREGRRSGDGHCHGGQPGLNAVDADLFFRFTAHHQ